ncbi:hypothetical protein BDV93DRAFT_552523 [Ceratobasidium sp. AG-I]|nr:hypothetical protein BDV93DRAFT_552523 [Ceratobasidium sp. AG-I]
MISPGSDAYPTLSGLLRIVGRGGYFRRAKVIDRMQLACSMFSIAQLTLIKDASTKYAPNSTKFGLQGSLFGLSALCDALWTHRRSSFDRLLDIGSSLRQLVVLPWHIPSLYGLIAWCKERSQIACSTLTPVGKFVIYLAVAIVKFDRRPHQLHHQES